MSRTYKKLIISMLSAVLAGSTVFAIDSEFKNNLTGLNLTKTGENSYNINLYTSKKISAPVKVIKKSDLNYYILLPETKNSTSNVSSSSSDIRSMDATLYPYAGVDVNNGYTKININTTKPISFNVVTMSSNQKTANTSTVASNNSIIEKKVEKKNSEIQKESVKSQTTKPEVIKQEQKKLTNDTTKKQLTSQTSSKKQVQPEKKQEQVSTKPAQKTVVAQNNVVKKVDIKSENKTTKVQVQKPAEKKIVIDKKSGQKPAEAVKIAQNQQQTAPKTNIKQTIKDKTSNIKELVKSKADVMAAAKITPEEIEKEEIKEEIKEEAKKEDKLENISKENTEEVQAENTAADLVPLAPTDKVEAKKPEKITKVKLNKVKLKNRISFKKISPKPILTKLKNKTKTIFSKTKNISKKAYTGLSNKLYEYGLTVLDLLFMLFAGIFSFVAVLVILNRKQTQPKLKNKAELVEKQEPPLVPKKEEDKGENNGQYFVFENNIKQTGLTPPVENEEKKNFELVSYDPDVQINYDIKKDSDDDDADMLEKILSEDSFIDVPEEVQQQNVALKQQEEIIEQPETIEPIKQSEAVTSPIGAEHVQKEEIILPTGDEPILLSSCEIASEQGFMLISYNDKISLMGYIHDDVYVLHNFKESKLANNNIQYRLVDADEQSSVYMVKASDIKLLVKATNNSMNTEIML